MNKQWKEIQMQGEICNISDILFMFTISYFQPIFGYSFNFFVESHV